MGNLIQADIFFFVTTIAVVLIASLFLVVIVYIVRILNDVHYISGVVRKETDLIAEDIEEFREEVKRIGIFKSLYAAILRLFNKPAERSKTEKTKKSKKR